MATMQEFEALLKNVLSPDNNVRRDAEAVYRGMLEQSAEQIVQALVHVARFATDQFSRQLAIILLRRALIHGVKDAIYPALSPTTKALVRTELFNALEQEASPIVRPKLCDTVADIASKFWGEEIVAVLQHLHKLFKSESVNHRDASLIVYSQLISLLGVQLKPHFATLFQVIVESLSDPDFKVRVSGVMMTTAFIFALKTPQERAEFQNLIPPMLKLLSDLLLSAAYDHAVTVEQLFTEWAEKDPTFFTPHMVLVVDSFIKIASAATFPDVVRQSAVEFLISLPKKKPLLMSKVPGYTERTIEVLIQMLLTLQDLPLQEWNELTSEDVYDISNHDVAEGAVNRLCVQMGGEQIVPAVFPKLPILINTAADWKARHTGLLLISLLGEGCKKEMKPHLGDLVALMLPRFQDQHPRVRWSALNAAGQLCMDLGPRPQVSFHKELIPSFLGLLDDEANPKVRAHAAAAITAFSTKLTYDNKDVLRPYIDEILKRLYIMLSIRTPMVLEETLTSIAALGSAVGEAFVPYYATFMPALKSILAATLTSNYHTIRGKVIEAISVIGYSVGRETFLPDATEMLNLLQQAHNGQHLLGDYRELVLHASARVCECIGADFVPYLPLFMPMLLTTASVDNRSYLRVLDAEQPEDEDGFDYIVFKDKKVAIQNSVLEEKCSSIQIIYLYVEALQEAIFPWIEQILQVVVPLCKFALHQGVRCAAVSILPVALSAVSKHVQLRGADPQFYFQSFEYTFKNLISSAQEEVDLEALVVQIDAIHTCIDTSPNDTLSAENVQLSLEFIGHVLNEFKESRKERAMRKSMGDCDEEDEIMFVTEEAQEHDCIVELAEIFGILCASQRLHFMPLFQNYVTLVMDLVNNPNSCTGERQLGLCMVDDLVEHTKESSLPLFPHFLERMFHCVAEPNPGIRQAAVYGLGVCAQHGGAVFSQFAQQAIAQISTVITPEWREDEDYTKPTENAICAVGKILFHQAAAVNAEAVTPVWLSWLPLTADLEEAKICHPLLCQFIETNNANIWGTNFANMPRILSIFATIVDTSMCLVETAVRIQAILTQIQRSAPQLFQQAVATLSAPEQEKLRVLIEKGPTKPNPLPERLPLV